MPRYAITGKAGRFVAARSNTGVGSVLLLTEKQAEHELRLGTLIALDRASRGSSRREDPVEPTIMAEPEQAVQEVAPPIIGSGAAASGAAVSKVANKTRKRRGKRQE